MAIMPDQFQGAFQEIAINVIEFSGSLGPAQDRSGLQLNRSALLDRILIYRSEDSSTSSIFSVSRTTTKPCNTILLKLTPQKTRFPEIEGSGVEVLLRFSRVRCEDAKIPRYRATLAPRESLGLSNHRLTSIALVKPHQPNRMLLLGWLARQRSVPHESRSILESATGQDGSEKEKETYRDRMHRYTALLRLHGPYAPKDDIGSRTGALLSDLDRLMMAFQSSR
jgi:hypothetical protein